MGRIFNLEKWKKLARCSGWVAILLAFLLAACNQTTTPTLSPADPTLTPSPTRASPTRFTPRPMFVSTPTATPASNFDLEASDLQDVEIVFWHPWSDETGKIITELVNEFNRSNDWGIVVQAEYQGGYDELYENVNAALGSESGPDLVAGFYYQGLNWHSSDHELVELLPYVDDPVWGFSPSEQADFYPGLWGQELWENGRFGIPAQRTAQLLYYNLTWAKELGFNTAPTTPDQFQRQACAAANTKLADTDRANDGTGGLIISTDYDAILNWIFAFDGNVVSSGGDRYTFNTPEVRAAFNFLRELFDEGCTWVSELEMPEAEFASRQGLFSIGSAAGIPSQEAAFADLSSKDEWTVIPFPSGRSQAALATYGPSFMVFQSRPDRELASWLLIKWLTSPTSQARIAQASAHFPVRASSLDLLDRLPQTYPQWSVAAAFLPSARSEPPFASWRIVRWAVSDAATQLFRYYFETFQVPQLVRLLDETANDLHDPD
ncbi:MAG TPA: extracellular solute-binding protein [Anaerolineales bacterium]|nr:extracellular solute-binding protein [Anaerolineales bacterium]